MRAKLDLTLSFKDKLQQLTQFNRALVYGFDPESSPNYREGSAKFEDYLYPTTDQFEDMLEGYLFAQNEMIKIISQLEEDSIDESTFIHYIKQLHGFIGKTLLEFVDRKSGEFAELQLMRWNPSVETHMLTYLIILGMTHPNLKGIDPTTCLIDLLTTKLGLTKEEVLQFIGILERLKKDPHISPRVSQLKYISDDDIATLTMEKMAVAYLGNLLPQEERELVAKIVTICRDPNEIPGAMEEFAKTTIAQWKNCEKQDLRALSAFLAEMFYQLTDIHPFVNANGRTATCLINVFLRSIGLPSILMRNPGERDISSSSYSLAIETINQTRTPLANHIYQRIMEAKTGTFLNEKLEETIVLRCQLTSQLRQLKSKNPALDMNRYQAILNQFFLSPEISHLAKEDQTIFALKKANEFLIKEEVRLDSVSKSGFITTTTLNALQKDKLKQDLAFLTNTDGWKINPKNHLESWIEIPVKAEAEKIAAVLRESGIGEVSLSKRRDNHIPVIKCSNIKIDLLTDKINLIKIETGANLSSRSSTGC